MTGGPFDGLWRRRSLRLGDAAPSETASVHWIQWGDHYLDLRVPDGRPQPFCGPGTFGGATTWADPVLTWHHGLDSAPGGGADEGVIRWLAEGLLEERGVAPMADGPLPYVEVWSRIGARPDAGRCWSPAPGAFAVEAGPDRMAALVHSSGVWCAGRSRLARGGAWRLCESAGGGALPSSLRAALLEQA